MIFLFKLLYNREYKKNKKNKGKYENLKYNKYCYKKII